MQPSDDRVEEIRERLIMATQSDDTHGILRGLRDLEDIGWKNVSVVTRYVGINGEMLEIRTWLNGGIRIIAPGTTRAFRVIWLLRIKEMVKKGHYKWVKHQNEMSPEEWEWLHNVDEIQ